MLNIGSLNLSSNLILAPMAGISDFPFRMLNRKFGCELAFVEMINVHSISHKSKKTAQMLFSHKDDRPLGIQLLGNEQKYIEKAIDILKKYKFDLLDFNAACPARKVVKRGEGAGLLREPKKLEKLLKIIVKNSSWPVTLKIRSGWDKDSVNAKEIAVIAEGCGINGLFIHGRTKLQEYSGKVDYKSIKAAKKTVKIPVIGSGDNFSTSLIEKMFAETNCDAACVARGALGNPWIFKGTQPAEEEIISTMLEHLDGCIDFYGERSAILLFRKFFAWYTKGFRNVRHLREKCCHAKSKKDVLHIVEELQKL